MNLTLWIAIAAVLLYCWSIYCVIAQMKGKQALSSAAVMVPGGVAVLLHLATLADTLVTEEGIRLGLFPVASLIAATGSAIIVMAGFYRRNIWVSAIIFPFSALTIFPALLVKSGFMPETLDHGVGAHVLASIVAYGVLGVAAAQATLVAIQHSQLKQGHIRGVMRLFPPMQSMENMLFDILRVGTALLTLAILLGFAYVDNLLEQHLAHKTVFTLISWFGYLVLLTGHHFLGWRSKTAVRFTLINFAILALGFFGSQLVLEFILNGD